MMFVWFYLVQLYTAKVTLSRFAGCDVKSDKSNYLCFLETFINRDDGND